MGHGSSKHCDHKGREAFRNDKYHCMSCHSFDFPGWKHLLDIIKIHSSNRRVVDGRALLTEPVTTLRAWSLTVVGETSL